MYLQLAEKYGMKFYFGLYDSGRYWDTGDLSWEIEDNKYVIDEVSSLQITSSDGVAGLPINNSTLLNPKLVDDAINEATLSMRQAKEKI